MFNAFYAEASDDRAIFANKVLKMLYQKYQGSLLSLTFLKELAELHVYFEEYVRNIYECIDREIPLLAWSNYMHHGFDKTAFDEGEMTEEQWKNIIIEACEKYYK